jgi:hypothetical protein
MSVAGDRSEEIETVRERERERERERKRERERVRAEREREGNNRKNTLCCLRVTPMIYISLL